MARPQVTNTRPPSTTTSWKMAKIKRRPAGPVSTAGGAARWSRWAKRDPRERLTIQVRFRGGAECWWLVEARGTQAVFPGHLSLHDVMTEINLGRARYIDSDE